MFKDMEKSLLRFIPAIKLSKNHQTQCNIRDMRDIRERQNDACISKFANELHVSSCNIQLQFKVPDQIIYVKIIVN